MESERNISNEAATINSLCLVVISVVNLRQAINSNKKNRLKYNN